jgi:ribosome-binding protein aMBF1 (putative translation factor)
MTDAMSRGRRLTPEEAARFRQMREQAQAEKAEIVQRLQTEQPGPATWADFHELRSLIDSLRAEREKRGLSREEVARRAMLDVRQIAELEEHRELNPSLSTLTRFATAVGRHLMLGLAAGTPIHADLPIAPSQAPSESVNSPAT